MSVAGGFGVRRGHCVFRNVHKLFSPIPDASRSAGLKTHHGVLNMFLVQSWTPRVACALVLRVNEQETV